MLYQIYEAQRSLMEPFADFAQAAAKLYSNPLSPLGQTPLAQRVAAGYDLLYRLGKDYEKPAFGITTVDVDGVGVAIHERIEMDKPFCELRRFKRFSDDPATLAKLKVQPVVLVVAPLSGHYATLLRDTVKTMLKDHKVYITDWTNARLVPLSDGEFHLDDYVNYVQEFIRHVQKRYGNCHVMSVCQPTVPVLAAVSLMASRGELTPLSMVMMGGPIDARKSPTAVNNLATKKDHKWFESHVIYSVPSRFPGAGRRVYPGFLQHSGFVAMNPSNHARSHYDYFQDLIKGDSSSVESHRKFYDEYNAVLDMDANYYLETIKTVFQEFNLVNGTWDVKGVDGKIERVQPQDIKTTALLSVEGELDDISGSGQTEAVHTICSGVAKSKQQHLEVEGAGHYGIFAGRRWRETVYPIVKAFIKKYQAELSSKQPASASPANKAVAVKPVPAAPSARQTNTVKAEVAPVATEKSAPTKPKKPVKTVAASAPTVMAATVEAVPAKTAAPSVSPELVKPEAASTVLPIPTPEAPPAPPATVTLAAAEVQEPAQTTPPPVASKPATRPATSRKK